MEEMAYFGVFATILLLIKNDFIYDSFDQLKKAYVYLVYVYAKTFFSIFVFCPKIDQKYTPVFFLIPPLKLTMSKFIKKAIFGDFSYSFSKFLNSCQHFRKTALCLFSSP